MRNERKLYTQNDEYVGRQTNLKSSLGVLYTKTEKRKPMLHQERNEAKQNKADDICLFISCYVA